MMKVLKWMGVLFMFVFLLGCQQTNPNENLENESSGVEVLGEKDNPKTIMVLFYGDGCPHCHEEIDFLKEIVDDFDGLRIELYETWKNKDNSSLLQKMGAAYQLEIGGVPATFIGDNKPIIGFGTAETTGKQIRDYLQKCQAMDCVYPLDKISE